jgi:hypothetical protein
MENIIQKLKAVKTMPELDALRIESVNEMQKAETEKKGSYREIQVAFIKAKNRLLRVPLKERTW